MRSVLVTLKTLLYLMAAVVIVFVPYGTAYALLWHLCKVGTDGCYEGNAFAMIFYVLPLSAIIWSVYLVLHGKKYILKTFHLIDKLTPIWLSIITVIMALLLFVPFFSNDFFFSDTHSSYISIVQFIYLTIKNL